MLVRTENNRSFFAACVTSFILKTEWGIATVLLPLQVHELNGSPVEVGLVYTVFAGIMTISPLFWGNLSDSMGRRKVFIVLGMLGLPPIFISMAFQGNVLALILLRGSTAIFKGAVEPCIWALASDLSFSEALGRNLGILNAADVAGFAVGPVLGGIISDRYGFPNLWFFVALICLVGGLTFLFAGTDSARLCRRERKTQILGVTQKKSLVSKILVIAIAYAIFLFGYSFLGPNLNVYLIDLGYTKTGIGMLAFIGTGIAALTQPVFGYLSDRHGRKFIMVLGGISLAFGDLVLLLGGSVHLVVLSYVLMGLYNSFRMAASAYICETVTLGERSGALSILNSMGSFARSSASAVGGLVIEATDIPTALKIATVFPTVATLMVLIVVKESKHPSEARHRPEDA